MQLDYSIEEMLLQSPTLVVYKARGRNGFRYAISRFIYTKSILSNLKEACFDSALTELKRLTHGCLRPVIDGGLDEVDGMPWVARVWWDGEYLDDRINKGQVTPSDVQRLADHGQSLIEALGDRAGAISFKPRDIILTTGRGGQPVETFNIDVKNWFRDWAMGMPPGAGRNAESDLNKLVMEAEMAARSRMTSPEEAYYGHQQLAIPQPPPTQVMVAPPPVTQSLIPATAPSGPMFPMASSPQAPIPAPPSTVPLLTVGGQAPPNSIPSPPPSGPITQGMGYSQAPGPVPSGQVIPIPFSNSSTVPAPIPSGPLIPVSQAGVPNPYPGESMVPEPSPSQMLAQDQGQEGEAIPIVANKLIVQQPVHPRRRLQFQ